MNLNARELRDSKIITLYQGGLSLKKVASIVDLKSSSRVRKILEKNMIRRRGFSEACKEYSVNEEFFEIIDSEEKAYWLGFIAADGYISDTRNKLLFGISCSIKDKSHLLKFRKIINSDYPQRVRKRIQLSGLETSSFVIQFSSDTFVLNLVDKGVTPRKSLTLQPPKGVPDNLLHHWIRGYFDGDGCVYINKRGRRVISFSGTEEVLNFILKQVSIKNRVSSRPRSKAYNTSFVAKTKVERWIEYIYKDATIYLGRKHEKAN